MRPVRRLLAIGLAAACSTPSIAQVTDVEQMPERFIELFRQGDLPALTACSHATPRTFQS
jgi:hypothetical protein